MENIISKIIEEMKKQGLSETRLAEKAGLNQKRVNNLLAGRTKRLDVPIVIMLCNALGMPAEFITNTRVFEMSGGAVVGGSMNIQTSQAPHYAAQGLTIKGDPPPPLDRDLFTKALQGTTRLTEGMELSDDAKIDMAGKLYDELYKVKYQKKDGE